MGREDDRKQRVHYAPDMTLTRVSAICATAAWFFTHVECVSPTACDTLTQYCSLENDFAYRTARDFRLGAVSSENPERGLVLKNEQIQAYILSIAL